METRQAEDSTPISRIISGLLRVTQNSVISYHVHVSVYNRAYCLQRAGESALFCFKRMGLTNITKLYRLKNLNQGNKL